MGVTIGRVETNDIILDDGSVSRFHAWLQFDERAQTWSITDAESRNGTWVNGQSCEPRKKVLVPDQAEVRIGSASLRFLLPDALVAFINQRAKGSGR
jgi:pSer/pThr/pTyr-binding forkhead associated (FHA) protein